MKGNGKLGNLDSNYIYETNAKDASASNTLFVTHDVIKITLV